MNTGERQQKGSAQNRTTMVHDKSCDRVMAVRAEQPARDIHP